MEERITVEMTEACLETLILSLRVNEKYAKKWLIDSVDKALESTDKAVKAECLERYRYAESGHIRDTTGY